MDVTQGTNWLLTQGVLGVMLFLVGSAFIWYYLSNEKEKRELRLENKELNKLIFAQMDLRVQDGQTVIRENTSSLRDNSQALYVISEKIETNKSMARTQ